MKVVDTEGNILDVTKRAYEVVYKERGYKPYTEKKQTTSTSKKVKKNDNKSNSSK